MSFFEAFLISLLVIGPEVFKVQSQNFIQAGQPTATVMEGTDFTFEWNFSLQPGDRNKLKEIIFGTWSTGFIDSYFVTVKSNSEVYENPELIKKHPEFVGRVQWVGDVSKSYAAFRLVNVRLEDTNTYGCEINLGFFANTLESRIILTVERASNTSVFIQVPPSQINVVTGHTAEFKWKYRVSSIDRKLPSTLQWGKYENINFKALCTVSSNGVTTKDPGYLSRILANKTESFGATTYLLSLFRVTVLDEGKYGLMVVHGNRKILEHQVFLEVHEKPQIIASPSVNGPYIMGESLVLFCKTKGKPSPTVKWIKDGRPIKTERDKTDSVYYVMRLTKSDGGYYSCFASNHVGNVSSPRVHVRVQYAPSIIFPKETKTILSWKEHPTRLECIADADPPAQYSWQRADGKIFYTDIRGPANSSVLVVTPSSDPDFSNYTCAAKNKVGEDKAIFTLKPIGPPNPPIITRIEANRNALKVTWQEPSSKQDTPITGHVLKIKKKGEQAVKWKEIAFKAKSNYFILRNLTRATYYSIRLFATNVVGYSNSSTKKEVKTLWEGPPSSPKLRFKETITDTSQFHLTWDVPDNDGGAAVHLFTVWYQVVSSNRTSKDRWNTINVRATAYLLKLNWSSVYSITVTAWNKYGQSFFDPDNVARVTVLEEKPVMSNNTHLKNKSGDLRVRAVHSPKEAAKKDMILYLPVLSVLAIPLVVVLLVWRSKIRKKFLENGKYDTCPRVPVGPNIPSSNNCAGRNYANAEENCENGGEGFERIPDPQIRSWEFSRANLAIERVIGDGAFGVVSKAYALDLPNMKGWNTVAVKSLRESATEIEKRDLLSELSLLKKLKPHPHIIKLLGCITTSDSPIVIIEYVPYGDLLGYLRRSRGLHDHYYDDPDIKPLTNLTSQQMLRFAWQIADGMRYISSKKIIHRDLAARNVLVGENQRCKITDFGMARDVRLETIYVPRSEGRIPVKWTAIEAMTGAMNYSTKSDVWSFGVVLFEICTIGAEPYPGISPLKIPDVVRKGYRNPKPAYVKDELYAIMMNCWKEEPEERPTFESLCDVIRSLETRGGQNYVNVKDCLEAHENNIMESNA